MTVLKHWTLIGFSLVLGVILKGPVTMAQAAPDSVNPPVRNHINAPVDSANGNSFRFQANTHNNPQETADKTARQLLSAAIKAMGGKATLQNIKRIHLRGHSNKRYLAQSTRPGGPWIPSFSSVERWINYKHHSVRTKKVNYMWGRSIETIVSDGVAMRIINPGTKKERRGPGSMRSVRAANLLLALGPVRVLLTALNAKNLHTEPATALQHVPQKVVAFTWHQAPVHLYLNSYTSMPTLVEIKRPHPYSVFWNLWGEVTTRIYYSFWSLQPGGLMYPKQWNIYRNEMPALTLMVNSFELNGPKIKPVKMTDAIRKKFQQKGTIDDYPLSGPAQTIAPGIHLITGPWNTTIIEQPDGIVILEVPISSGYSKEVLTYVKKHFPDQSVKAVVSTNFAWPHVGGVREYVAKGFPLYVLDLNVPFIKRVLEAPHTMSPDELALNPKEPTFRVVSSKTVIGSEPNEIVLYPVRGESAERMMVAYFPAQKLLYASDIVQPKRSGDFYFPEYLYELAQVVKREGLDVKRVFAMHTPHPVKWKAVLQAIAKARNSQK